MEAKFKIVIREALLFSAIGFLIYVLAIAVSFMGCCLGITGLMFDRVVLTLVITGIVVFGICSYFTC